nr:MAG TPA: hypothetical protein [Caudoviricetes sp.]
MNEPSHSWERSRGWLSLCPNQRRRGFAYILAQTSLTARR